MNIGWRSVPSAIVRRLRHLVPQLYPNIDVTREDIDLALGRAVPACSAASLAQRTAIGDFQPVGPDDAKDRHAT